MLDLISFVGVDELTDLKELVKLNELFYIKWQAEFGTFAPDLEFGFLYSKTRQYEDDLRYPTYNYILYAKDYLGQEGLKTSLHLCGEDAVEGYLNLDSDIYELIDTPNSYSRVQLNFNINKIDQDSFYSRIKEARRTHAKGLILQYNKTKAELMEMFMHTLNWESIVYGIDDLQIKFHILHDASGGFGREIENVWEPFNNHYTGYAGGLRPGNVYRVVELIEEKNSQKLPFYIDMESGIRENDRFSLEKCQIILDEVIDFYRNFPFLLKETK